MLSALPRVRASVRISLLPLFSPAIFAIIFLLLFIACFRGLLRYFSLSFSRGHAVSIFFISPIFFFEIAGCCHYAAIIALSFIHIVFAMPFRFTAMPLAKIRDAADTLMRGATLLCCSRQHAGCHASAAAPFRSDAAALASFVAGHDGQREHAFRLLPFSLR